MNPNPMGMLATVGALMAFWLVYRVLRPKARRTTWGWIAALSFPAVPGILFAVYYLHLLPETAWFYQLRSRPGTELLSILPGALLGALAAAFPTFLRIGFLLVAGVLAVVPYLKPLVGPLPAEQFKETWRDGACLQSTMATCGPASCATILRSIGLEAGERELARDAFTYAGGTEAWYLARALRKRGCVVRFRFRERFDESTMLPVMAGVKVGTYGHFIPIIRREGERYLIADPMTGPEWVSTDKLLGTYRFTGFYMEIEKQPGPR